MIFFLNRYIFLHFPTMILKKIQLNKITCNLLEVLIKGKLLQSDYKMYQGIVKKIINLNELFSDS